MSADEIERRADAAAPSSDPVSRADVKNERTQIGDDTSAAPRRGTGGPQCASPEGATEFWLGKTLGRYGVVELLGIGGMGVVYRAHDAQIERDVAIKLLPDALAKDPKILERFLAEARAAGKLAHPNVVAIYEIGQQGDTHFIVMELLSGGNIGEWIERHGPCSVPEATQIVADTCQGLSAAHAAGLIHRDIKPSNLLRSQDGTVKIADFGLAKRLVATASNFTQAGQVVGTPYFMSPEQCESRDVDHRSDIYSLGATYYTLLTGINPYHDAGSTVQVMYSHCHGEPLDPQKFNPTIPDACSAIIARATAKKPQDRYPNAAAMRSDLLAVCRAAAADESSKLATSSHAAVPSRPSREMALSGGRTRPSRIVAGLGVAVGLACALAIGAFYWRAHRDNGVPDTPSAAATDPAHLPSATSPASLVPGVTENSITFGSTTAYSGSNRDLGVNMVLGIRACFEDVNEQGGIDGRRLKLTILDDGYEPDRALANLHELFDVRHVFGMVGNVGTPTAQVTAPYAVEHRVLLFAPLTGAGLVRHDPPERYVFNYRASYADETAALVKYFVEIKKIPPDRIAVFAQNDAYGNDGFQGVVRALRRYRVPDEQIVRTSYRRNSVDVAEAVERIQKARDRVRAVVMVPTYAAAAQFVKNLQDRSINVELGAVSFVGSESLAEQFREMGPKYGVGVVVTQVVPHYRSGATGVIRYRELLQKYFPEARPGSISLEGFVAAQCLVEGLRKAGPGLTTEKLIDALESIHDLDLGIGPIVSFGPSRHQASHKVWGLVLDEARNYRFLDLE